jgi:thioredoxin-like negative regulator of GroEL
MSRAGEQANVVIGAIEAVPTGQVKLVKVNGDTSPQIVVIK